jgi:signal transduction histidine kinase/CheY-like chemotaxis protein
MALSIMPPDIASAGRGADRYQNASADDQRLIECLASAPIGATIIDATGRAIYWNERLLGMLGAMSGDALAEAAARNFFKDPNRLATALGELAGGRSVADEEIDLDTHGETPGRASLSMRPIEFGERPAVLSWFIDITAHEIAKRDLEASEDALLSVLEAAPIGATVLDHDGRVLFWNSRLIDILGVQGDAFSEAASLVFNGDTSIRDNLLQEMRERGRVRDAWIAPARHDKTHLAALVSMEPVTFERQQGVLTWLYDVSELRRAQEVSEAATRAKSAFLATMSHEIRTPMNGVVTMAELLAETNLNQDQEAMVRVIRESGQSLLVVINDILDFSKIEAGRLEIESLPCSPSTLVNGVVSLLSPKAAEKGLEFRADIDTEIPPWVLGDPTRLRQILLNMASNAIKFTETGSIGISVERREDDILRFAVRDTGIGMSEEVVASLFRAFNQADASTARKFGGTGLGLSICQGLAELMGGAIKASSAPGVGSNFWLDLPLIPCDPPVEETAAGKRDASRQWLAPSAAEARAANAVILCAEDNAINRDVLARVLGRLGFVVEMVENGALALQALHERSYGLLLTDCHMPVLDGWALARAVRSRERSTGIPRIPIIALTADIVQGTEERCLNAGMDSYVTKPVPINVAERIIAQYLPIALELRQETDPNDAPAGYLVDSDGAINVETLTELIGTDPVILRRVLGDYLSTAATMVKTIGPQIDSDVEEAHRAAHGLKSASRYVGATALGDVAAAVEEALRTGDLNTARQKAIRLGPHFEAVERAIHNFSLSQNLVEVRSELGQMTHEDGGTELSAVVGITEEAASRILEAAEAIAERIERIEDSDEARLIQGKLTAIFEACSFQDLTSQRLRKAIARLAAIEEKLDVTVRRLTDQPAAVEQDSGAAIVHRKPDEDIQDQAAIDRLFAGGD